MLICGTKCPGTWDNAGLLHWDVFLAGIGVWGFVWCMGCVGVAVCLEVGVAVVVVVLACGWGVCFVGVGALYWVFGMGVDGFCVELRCLVLRCVVGGGWVVVGVCFLFGWG